jgi:hypothetical protein
MTTPTIFQLPTPLAGTVGILPVQKYMVVGDNLSTITTAGYLNAVNLESYPIVATDIINALYSFNPNTATGTFEQFSVSISNGVITLVALSNAGEVTLPTIANHIATYTNTSGHLSEDPATAISGGNIQAGLSGTAGTLASFPGTASKGSLVLAAVANTGNTTTTISNDAMGQASVINIPDPANAIGQVMIGATATPFVSGNFPVNSGTAGLMTDSGVAATNLMQLTAVNTLSGSGQIILQKANGTEATNAVTASGNAGVITTSSLTTAGGSSYAITWTNTKISATSAILLTIMGGTNTTENITLKATAGTGTSTLTIYNNTAATALNGTILIGYTVL